MLGGLLQSFRPYLRSIARHGLPDDLRGKCDAAGRAALMERVSAYVTKALREAKIHTSWINVNEAYESGVHRFLGSLLADTPDNDFLPDLERFVARVWLPGM